MSRKNESHRTCEAVAVFMNSLSMTHTPPLRHFHQVPEYRADPGLFLSGTGQARLIVRIKSGLGVGHARCSIITGQAKERERPHTLHREGCVGGFCQPGESV
ncbi:hypothetical protein Y032_0454g1737 [Ancylostoma ceylanicum]|uniref:Uncharacterized protein n=1 Tax=Ancylostoma ceylanicum TaxID=53326 RepID=A0A016WZI5_9BILA|nr:hypothetical protein Y032_0454g1737 [Ancylostoma ceylanicum]